MDQSVHKVTLLPENQSVEVPAGATLREALALLEVIVTAPCGGEGTCGKCTVRLENGAEGVTPITSSERALLTLEQLGAGIRLSCHARVSGDTTVSVPPASRASEMRVLAGGKGRNVPVQPAVVKTVVTMPPQTLDEPYARLEHLRRCGSLRADLRADLEMLRRMPAILEAGDPVTAVMHGNRLLDLQPGDTSGTCFGLALDLGTTTVVATLIDLITGRDVARASMTNRQTAYGHDVVGRINLTIEKPDGLETLRRAALESLNRVTDQVVDRAGIRREDIYEATVVGNATMMHLFLGIFPASLGKLPYIATVGDSVTAPADEVGLNLSPNTPVYVLPNIAGFVGADTVGAILATSLDEDDGRIRMMADIGTNCEIALRIGERLIVTSTPAGPAFEGARIACGMYAAPGAIEEIVINGDVHCKTIGSEPPRGLCGSGLVDACAELLRVGVVDWTGRMLPVAEHDGSLPGFLLDRLAEHENDLAFTLSQSDSGAPIVLTQRDFRELQLAKGAIRTGIDLLLEKAGLTVDDLDEFCVAGGFGNYLNEANAVRLGLLPRLPSGKIRFVGNGALVGAKLTLLSSAMRQTGELVARQAEHLQIAGTPDFQMRFSEAMLFEPQGGE